MSGDESDYASYLLRLRRFEVEGQPAWRASLESVRTGERQSFTAAELLAFLRARLMARGEDVPDHESGD
jgi:hypothetical protein